MHNTHMNKELRQLHEVLVDLVGFLNQPKHDEILIKEAGISLDRALFPLLVIIERRGPMGIVKLAGHVGRDYTTVSRQVAKLESLDLVVRQANQADARVNNVTITKKGKKMTDALDAARERLALPILAKWDEKDRKDLVRLLRKFVDDALALTACKGDAL
jgi:DNA-binding MarR family transcriptional regulator